MLDIVPKSVRRGPPRRLYVSQYYEDFFRGLASRAQGLGFEHCAYLIGVPQPEEDWQFVMLNNYPRPWQDRYCRRGYYAIDPTIQHAKTKGTSLTWSPALFEHEALAALSRDVRNLGFNYGWTQPLPEANGMFGVLTLARGDGAITSAELEAKRLTLQWLAQVAHAMLFRVLLARHRNESISLLSEREIEFLRLASVGRTAEEISRALEISERTANFHSKKITKKLGAMNKTHAVVLAMRMGLLD